MSSSIQKQSKVLVILGMHRSGTSLTTQWLYKMGLHVGDALLGAAESNKDGHFEDLDFFHFHKDILDSNDVLYYASRKDNISITEAEHQRAQELIKSKAAEEQWAWKDPRTCLFIEFWDELLRKQSLSPKYLLVYRPLEQVVDSLVRRDIVELKSNPNPLKRWVHLRRYQKGLKKLQHAYKESWINHLLEMKRLAEREPKDCLILDASTLLNKQKKIHRKLTEDWGFKLEYLDFETIYDKSQLASLASISKYADKEIQELHDFFTKEMDF
ncbi:hypothetical protein N9B82_04570 [Saprospiraceae bacterium]|nr:hypothetical protein [Saprospiraceae bacterium]